MFAGSFFSYSLFCFSIHLFDHSSRQAELTSLTREQSQGECSNSLRFSSFIFRFKPSSSSQFSGVISNHGLPNILNDKPSRHPPARPLRRMHNRNLSPRHILLLLPRQSRRKCHLHRPLRRLPRRVYPHLCPNPTSDRV